MNDANPKLIGAFVLGGLLLVVLSILLFSTQDYFAPKRSFVAYFQQSVNGLNVGAPVLFRGIPLGEVTAIEGIYNPETGGMIPRITLQIKPAVLQNAVLNEGEYTLFPLLLKSGMRASLKAQSLLTGLLYVELDFHPSEPIRRIGTEDDPYPEMPTLDSGFDEAIARLSSLPVEELTAEALGTLGTIQAVVSNPAIADSIGRLPMLINDLDHLVKSLNSYVEGDLVRVTRSLDATLGTTRATIQSMGNAFTEDTLVRVDATLANMDSTLDRARARLSDDDSLNQELLNTLRDLRRTARSFKDLAETIEEKPEILLRGKRE